MVWNGLDYPACVFGVSKVDPSVDVKQPRDAFLSEADKFVYNLCMFSLLKKRSISFPEQRFYVL